VPVQLLVLGVIILGKPKKESGRGPKKNFISLDCQGPRHKICGHYKIEINKEE